MKFQEQPITDGEGAVISIETSTGLAIERRVSRGWARRLIISIAMFAVVAASTLGAARPAAAHGSFIPSNSFGCHRDYATNTRVVSFGNPTLSQAKYVRFWIFEANRIDYGIVTFPGQGWIGPTKWFGGDLRRTSNWLYDYQRRLWVDRISVSVPAFNLEQSVGPMESVTAEVVWADGHTGYYSLGMSISC